jgi:hypothetical protein
MALAGVAVRVAARPQPAANRSVTSRAAEVMAAGRVPTRCVRGGFSCLDRDSATMCHLLVPTSSDALVSFAQTIVSILFLLHAQRDHSATVAEFKSAIAQKVSSH